MTHGSLFSGIGGFDLAAEWMGWENKFHCEWNEFGQKVLNYYWPNAECFSDITKSCFKKYNGKIDIISGGFPCQPYSLAGKRKGKEDARHLWPEMLRAIREVQPVYIVGENVAGLTNWNGGLVFDEVQADLENEGYEVTPFLLPACAVNAPHRRDRIWFVAYSNSQRYYNANRTEESNLAGKVCKNTQQSGNEWRSEDCRLNDEQFTTNTTVEGLERRIGRTPERNGFTINSQPIQWENFPTQSPICSRDDGVSSELVGITFPKHRKESIKGYGNAIVPQVALQIFKTINEYAKTTYNNPREDKQSKGLSTEE